MFISFGESAIGMLYQCNRNLVIVKGKMSYE